jgi:hypothetical protein
MSGGLLLYAGAYLRRRKPFMFRRNGETSKGKTFRQKHTRQPFTCLNDKMCVILVKLLYNYGGNV